MTNCEHNWVRADGIYALTRVRKESNGIISFIPTNGVPVDVQVCNKCGEIKLHSAIMKGMI